MAAGGVLRALAVCSIMVFAAAQCPAAFTAYYTSACCDNVVNMGVFGAPTCCRPAGTDDCVCDPNSQIYGADCMASGGAVTTPPPTTTPDPAAPLPDTTASSGTATGAGTNPAATSADPAMTTMPPTTTPPMTTTTEMPTTTMEPLCPVPGPVARSLGAQPVGRCSENGVVAFSLEFNGNPRILLCHGAFVYNETSGRREIWTSEYCWNQIRLNFGQPGFTVYGTLQGNDFEVNDCFIGEPTVNNVGIAKIPLPDITEWYLDAIGTELGCRDVACIPQDDFRSRINYQKCYLVNYGATTPPANTVLFENVAKKLELTGEPRSSVCGGQTTPAQYTTDNTDQFCFLAKEGTGGANCKLADASSPVYCMTDTNEPVLAAFTIPNDSCDANTNTFLSDLL